MSSSFEGSEKALAISLGFSFFYAASGHQKDLESTWQKLIRWYTKDVIKLALNHTLLTSKSSLVLPS